MCTCVYVGADVCVHACVYMHKCLLPNVYIRLYMCVFAYVCMYMLVCMLMFCMHVYTFVPAFACLVCFPIIRRMHIHVHVCINGIVFL